VDQRALRWGGGGGGGGKDKVLALFMVNISIDLNDFVYSLKDCPKA